MRIPSGAAPKCHPTELPEHQNTHRLATVSDPIVTEPGSVAESDPDDEWAQRFRAGDEAALRAVFDRYGGMVQRLGVLRLGDIHEAEELVQQVLVRAWRGRAGFDPTRGSLGGWLMGIARRLIADRYASFDRDRRISSAAQLAAPTPILEGPADRVVDAVVMSDQVSRLPPPQQLVLRLAFYEGMSHSEIATSTGLPLGTVKSHIRRALQTLRGAWEVDDVTS